MTVGTPSWLAASGGLPAYDATELRTIDTMLARYNGHNLGGRSGVRPGGTPLNVTLSGSPLNWNVATGIGMIDATATGQLGVYVVPVTATESGPINAAHATNPRKDIVVLTVKDAEAGDGTREGIVQYIAGTPAGSPVAPPVPARSLLLGTITVPANNLAGSSVVVAIPKTVATGGILPTSTQPATPHVGEVIYREDTGDIEVYNGSAWIARPLLAPAAKMIQRVAQSFTHGSVATVTFGSPAIHNIGGMADFANNRINIPRPGLYDIKGRIIFAGTQTTGYRRLDLFVNAATVGIEIVAPVAAFGANTSVSIHETMVLATNDTVTIRGLQTNVPTAAVNSVVGTDFFSFLEVTYLGPAA